MPLHTHAHLWPTTRKTLFPLAPLAPRRVTPSVFAQDALMQQKAARKSARVQVSEPVETWRQMALKNVPPAPKRREKPLPLGVLALRAYVSEQWAQGAWEGHEAKALAKVIKRMTLDSVIYSGEFSLTLVAVDKGYPHYRLMWGSHIFGVADIPAMFDWKTGQYTVCAELPAIQTELARYLVGCGFTAEMATRTLTPGAAKTPYTASKRALYHLLKPVQTFDRGRAALTVLCDLASQLEDCDNTLTLYAALVLSLLSTIETGDAQSTRQRQIDAVLCAVVVQMILTSDVLIPRQPMLF